MCSGGLVRFLARTLLTAPIIALALLLFVAAPPRAALALDAEESAFLGIINGYRTANGLGPLSASPQLTAAAGWMAQDMGAKGYFSHTDSLGRDPFRRMDDFGYAYNTWRGENLGAAIETAQAALNAWKASPAHNSVMLTPNFKAIGIARVYVPGSPYGWYWATDFGGQVDSEPQAPPPTPAPPPPPTPAPPPPPPPPTQAPAPPRSVAVQPLRAAATPDAAREAQPVASPDPAPPPEPKPTLYTGNDWDRALTAYLEMAIGGRQVD